MNFTKLLGARIRSEANDLKRTTQALASDLELEKDYVEKLLQGNCDVEEQFQLIEKMGKAYPIDENDLKLFTAEQLVPVKIMRGTESERTSRTTNRADKNGNLTPYYEYRDTAMSKVSPYRPEWIRQLRVVENCDPKNPDVQYNKGHLLHQYTLFVGPVNYYWELNGEKFSMEMNTGDSVYGTPWWPHTFTNRDGGSLAFILAVTFGGDVRRAQKELYALGKRSKNFLFNYRKPGLANKELVTMHARNSDLTDNLLDKKLKNIGASFSIQGYVDDELYKNSECRKLLAQALDVEEMDLLIPEYKVSDEVLIKKYNKSESYHYPSDNNPHYEINKMALTTKMPLMRGSTIKVLNNNISLEHGFFHSLHSWVYNFGTSTARFSWMENETVMHAELAPGDSAYIQPYVKHAYAKCKSEDQAPHLCVIRTCGHLNVQAQRELSYMSEPERAFYEPGCWF